MRLLLVLVLSSLLLPAETRLERGKKVLDEALAALGGEQFLAVRDRVEEGRAYSFYREELSGLARAKVYTRYLTRPEPPVPGSIFVRERQNFGKDEDSGVIFMEDGKAWQISFRGARPAPADMIERYQQSTLLNIFYILRQRLGEPGLIIESRGSEVWMNQPVDLVDITDAENNSVTVYFHHSTKLPVRQMFVRRDPKTRERFEEETIFSKYRDVGGGVQWPYTMQRTRNGEKIFEIYSDSVTINTGLTDDLFMLPVGMKILKAQPQ